MTPAIALKGVRKHYDEFALHDIDLELVRVPVVHQAVVAIRCGRVLE